jgi:hypothetical protein
MFLLVAIALVVGMLRATGVQDPPPTRAIHYAPPQSLPTRAQAGECSASISAASYRSDAIRCVVADARYDPCFVTSRDGYVLCDVDPGTPSSGKLFTRAAAPSAERTASGAYPLAWFVELSDGSICRPLPGPGRDIDGASEIYGCAFTAVGENDAALLGDLDNTGLVWTAQKALLNKKSTPMTVKSLTVVTVKTAWQ